MSRSIFGSWYPPGCSGPPDDYDVACEVCGQDCYVCACQECPECGEAGNPRCYVPGCHGLVRTAEQIESRQKIEESWAAEAAADEAWAQQLAEQEEAYRKAEAAGELPF